MRPAMTPTDRQRLVHAAQDKIRSTRHLRGEQQVILRASQEALQRSQALLQASRARTAPAYAPAPQAHV